MIDWCNKFCCECYEIDIKCPYWNEKEKDTDCDNCEYFEEREENENDQTNRHYKMQNRVS